MTAVRAEWALQPLLPESPEDFLVATVSLPNVILAEMGHARHEDCELRLVDHVAPSGVHYRSISVHAPYQGRGLALHVEVNGVPLSLEWNGGNDREPPAMVQHADYHRELTAEQVAALREVPAPNNPRGEDAEAACRPKPAK